jgi:hypothetical protein
MNANMDELTQGTSIMTQVSSSYPSPSSSLDSQKHNRNRRCGVWSVQGQENNRLRYVRLGCKRWTCPQCGPKKAKRLQRAIAEKATQKGMNRFLTLTLNPATCTSHDSVGYIRECWSKFRTSLKRRLGKTISFISVLELQKSGYAHLHVLVDRYIEQAWVSESWQAVGGGRIVDIRQVDIHRVAPYLSKYLTKVLILAGVRPGQRRYTTSRDILLFVRQESGLWKLMKTPVEFLYSQELGDIVGEERDSEGILQWFVILLKSDDNP